ncbi:helix-turn-helix domain-containing protein [Companilactobacillus allii]|nr:helix-turn-helix transcriptional regulator [Companilactobacillus allii]USQ68927.1 helix-turn-helix domain-containing protein [Companilactobacillus allii]
MTKVELINAAEYIENEKRKNPELSRMMDIEENKMELAINISKLRRSLGYSQEEFAKKVNKPQSTIARIESGEGNPTMKTIFEIGYAVGKKVNISYE